MSQIGKHVMDFAMDAYHVLRDVPEDMHNRAAWSKSRHNEERWLEYVMFRRHWYFGEWTLFDGATYVASFDGYYLRDLYDVREREREERRQQCQREDCSEGRR